MNKKIAALLTVIFSASVMLGACAVKQSQETATASASPEASESGKIIVAEVNGEPIYYDQFHTIYANACAQYGIDENDETNGSYIKSMIMDSLINEKIMRQKLTENGYMELSSEDEAKAEKDAQDYLDSMVDSYYGSTIKAGLEEGYTDEQYQEAKKPYEEQVLQSIGYTKDEFYDYYKLMLAEDKAKTALVGNIEPTEDEIKAKYDENVAADKETMESDPAQYESTVSGGDTAYYVPEGVRVVRHVLFKIDETSAGAVKTLRDAGYDEQADYLLQNALSAIEQKATDVLNQIKSGKLSFDDAIATYNEDTGMPETGYTVVKGGTTFVESFTNGAMSLAAVGDITDLIPSDYGYHIIEYYGDMTPGPVPFDDVKQEVADSLKATMQDEAWQKIVDEWTSSSKIERYEENM